MQKVIAAGDIVVDNTSELYTYEDGHAAIVKFGKRIGEVYATLLGEEGFIEGIRNIAIDADDASGEPNLNFPKLLMDFKIDEDNYDCGSLVMFYNDRSDRIGLVVLLSWD